MNRTVGVAAGEFDCFAGVVVRRDGFGAGVCVGWVCTACRCDWVGATASVAAAVDIAAIAAYLPGWCWLLLALFFPYKTSDILWVYWFLYRILWFLPHAVDWYFLLYFLALHWFAITIRSIYPFPRVAMRATRCDCTAAISWIAARSADTAGQRWLFELKKEWGIAGTVAVCILGSGRLAICSIPAVISIFKSS